MIAARQKLPEAPSLPYGTGDLNPVVKSSPGPPRRVQCYVRGCDRWISISEGGSRREACPQHGIHCFHSSTGATYAYRDVRRNIIVSPDALVKRVIGHPFKYESHRLGLERSEDALTWNVFRSLQEAGVLHRLAQAITGDPLTAEPFLFVWGLCSTNDDFDPWKLLIQARNRFESNLPVERPLTEPDAALFLPGRYLILIEAKFCSRNTYYREGPRKDAASLTLDELRTIYCDLDLRILDRERADAAHRIHQQLWRNTVFAEWMSRQDHPRTRAFHVNLVRRGQDEVSAAEFRQLLRSQCQERFQQFTWEQIHKLYAGEPRLATLRRYLETKTAGLKRAFLLP